MKTRGEKNNNFIHCLVYSEYWLNGYYAIFFVPQLHCSGCGIQIQQYLAGKLVYFPLLIITTHY